MKKFLSLCLVLVVAFMVVGCGSKGIDLSTNEIIDKLYKGVEDLPMLENHDLTEENVIGYLGTDEVKFTEGTVSEPAMSSIAYLVVALKLEDSSDVDKTMELIKNSVDPRRWMCVEADDVRVINRGNTILLLMMNLEEKDRTDKIEKNFKNM